VAAKRDIAAVASSQLGLHAHAISAHILPTSPSELEAFLRLWEREATLLQSVLLLECDEIDMADVLRRKAIDRLINEVKSPLIIASRERRSSGNRNLITFDITRPSAKEQRAFWQNQLGTFAPSMNGQVEALVSQFNLSAQTIHAVCTEAFASIQNSSESNSQPVSNKYQKTTLNSQPCSGISVAPTPAHESKNWRSGWSRMQSGMTWCCQNRNCTSFVMLPFI
jgi:hypothetical protein